MFRSEEALGSLDPANALTGRRTLHEYTPLHAAHVFLSAKAADGIRLRFVLKFGSSGLGLAKFSLRSAAFPKTIKYSWLQEKWIVAMPSISFRDGL
jgi:hypothetical protein